jgi:hypothetical protein
MTLEHVFKYGGILAQIIVLASLADTAATMALIPLACQTLQCNALGEGAEYIFPFQWFWRNYS